jgi:hypothetical protein
MKIEKGIPVPKKLRGRRFKYDFAAMEIGDSFFVKGDSSTQVSILTCAKRHDPKKTFVTKKVNENGTDGYRCWRSK